MKTWIRNHQLISFFFVTFLIMYSVLFTVAFVNPAGWFKPWSLAWFLSIFSPTFGSLIVSAIIGGWDEVKRLLSGLFRWNVGVRWYVATLFLFWGPLLIGLIYVTMGNPYPGINPELTWGILAGQLFFNIFSGPVSEELGWRGFALPRLQQKFNALVSSLILGTMWALWHLPLFFIPGSDQSQIFFPIYLVLNIAFATYMTWLYNNTKGSVLIAILAHFCINISMATIVDRLRLMPSNNFYQMTAGPLLVLTLVLIVIIFGPRHFSRKSVSELPFKRA
jgi:membrane protease YdiL (CAAX protease family)